jgi:hypothetical protein
MSKAMAGRGDPIRHGWFWIAIAVLLAYWPLTTFQYGLSEGDTLDCWLPWRHFIAASLKDGGMPTWNPLQQMGYPIHADLQGPAWYPEALILGGTVGMGPHVLQLLFLLYLIIGGCGMRLFTRELIGHDQSALITGVAYALCGFFTAHAMHFYAVISAAWMPWLLWALLRLLKAPGRRTALIASVFLFLLLTGGNHTFLIVVAWPVVFLIALTCLEAWRRGDRDHVRAILMNGSLAIAAAVIMSCGTMHALWEVSPYINRVQGLDLASAQQEPFTPAALKSVLWPAAATADADALGTDITMGNGYFGVLMLLFAICGVRHVRGHAFWVFSVFALIAALAAFGPLLPVHGMLWRFVPGMDLFRFPSYFWYFVILFLLPVAGLGISRVLRREIKHLPLIVSGVFILLTLVMLVRKHMGGLGAVRCTTDRTDAGDHYRHLHDHRWRGVDRLAAVVHLLDPVPRPLLVLACVAGGGGDASCDPDHSVADHTWASFTGRAGRTDRSIACWAGGSTHAPHGDEFRRFTSDASALAEYPDLSRAAHAQRFQFILDGRP